MITLRQIVLGLVGVVICGLFQTTCPAEKQADAQPFAPMLIRYNNPNMRVPFRSPTGDQCRIRVYDWDGDGKLDLVDQDNGPNNIGIALNIGTKSKPYFSADRVFQIPIPRQDGGYGSMLKMQHYYGFDVVDWDRDGLPEFLAGGVILHHNIGKPGKAEFENAGPILIGGQPYPYQHKYTQGMFADLDGDGRRDLMISTIAHGTGEVGNAYCVGRQFTPVYEASTQPDWDITKSTWPMARLHFCKNVGSDDKPRFETIEEIKINGLAAKEFIHTWALIEVVDWTGGGYGDLIIGDCSRAIRYFKNARSQGVPEFVAELLPLEEGVKRLQEDFAPAGNLRLDHPVAEAPRHTNDFISIEMVQSQCTPSAIDWDDDGDLDIVISGNQTGIWVMENTGSNQKPMFKGPESLYYNKQDSRTAMVATDIFVVPQIVDWDGDGRQDLISGGETAYIYWCRNIGKSGKWEFELPKRLRDKQGDIIWMADFIDGYFDGLWCPGVPFHSSDYYGYTAPTVIDVDGDGDLDILLGDQSLHINFIENVGTRTKPILLKPRPLKQDGEIYAGAWRSRPAAVDFDGDGIIEVIHPTRVSDGDRDGIYYMFQIAGKGDTLHLTDAKPLLDEQGKPFKIVSDGRRQKLHVVDWDGDGDYDLLVGYIGGMVHYARNVGSNKAPRFVSKRLASRGDEFRVEYSGHGCGVWTHDWNNDGVLDLIGGASSGRFIVYDGRTLARD